MYFKKPKAQGSSAVLLIVGALFFIRESAAANRDCSNAMTQTDMNICAGIDYKKADDNLNSVYKKILSLIGEDKNLKSQLISAQKAWIVFRDNECTFASSAVSGGSIYPTVYASCTEELTKNRVKELEAYTRCKEGDLACPVPPK